MSNLHLSRASEALAEAGRAPADRAGGPGLSRPGPKATANAFKASAAALLVGQSEVDKAPTRPELQAYEQAIAMAKLNSKHAAAGRKLQLHGNLHHTDMSKPQMTVILLDRGLYTCKAASTAAAALRLSIPGLAG